MEYIHTDGLSLLDLVVENNVLSVTPDSKPSWDGTGYVLGWTISAAEPDGLHVSVYIPEGCARTAHLLILDAIQGARIARCPVCGKVDHWDHLVPVDAYPIYYGLHDSCVPLWVEDPRDVQDIIHEYPEPPGVWGWDPAGSFVGIKGVDAIREYLDAHGISYLE